MAEVAGMKSSVVWRLAESLVVQEKQSFCMEENPAACPVSIFSKIDPTVPCDAVRQALDLAEDLSEDAIEHHKNEIARLQSTLRSLRSFRADTTKITAILSGCE